MKDNIYKFKKRRKLPKIQIIILIMVLLILSGTGYLFYNYNIKEVIIIGNVHYDEDEIKGIISNSIILNNSFLTYLKSEIDSIPTIPFIDKIEFDYDTKNKLIVNVYEKNLAGCIKYMDKYVYFDKDGIVLEISSKRLNDIVLVTGFEYGELILNEKIILKNRDDGIFKTVLHITQMINKYNTNISKIYFDTSNKLILYSNNIKILVGDLSNINEKIAELNNILAKIGDKSGTLNMQQFTSDNRISSFSEINK